MTLIETRDMRHGTAGALLDDILAVWEESERQLPSMVLVARMQELDPHGYKNWTTTTLGVALRLIGLPTKHLRVRAEGRWITLKGLARQDVVDVHAALRLDESPEEAAVRSTWQGPVVYFAERQGFVKIGTTADLRARIRSINRGDSAIEGMTILPVRVLATMPGDRSVERAIHNLFRFLRFDGEWFLHESPLVEFVDAISAASEVR